MARILLLTHEYPPFRGGVATYARELARAAAALGHAPTLVAPDFGAPRAAEDRDEPFEIVRFRGAGFDRNALPALLTRTWGRLRRGGFDLVHAIDWPHILALSLIGRVRPVRFLATTYGTDILGPARSRLAGLLGARRFYRRADRIVAISGFTRDLLLGRFPETDPARVEVTPLGVSPFWARPTPDPARLRARFGIAEDHRIVLTVARLDPRKGHRTALRALSLLPRSLRSSLAYLIVGTGGDASYAAEARELARRSGTHVVFAGALDDADVRDLYALADLFLLPGEPHPGRVEGFGLVFLEAASQGLPAIAADVGACAEVVLDGVTGLVVPPRDVDRLAEAIARLLGDEPLRARLGREARRRASAFTWERCALLTYGPAGPRPDREAPARLARPLAIGGSAP
jgi:glycosyltransferase involved in cell wall biosynthesis